MVICQNFAPVYAPNIDQSPGILGPQFLAAIHNLLKLCEQSLFVLLTMLTWPTTGAASEGEGGIIFLLSLVIREWYVNIYCRFALVKYFQSCLERVPRTVHVFSIRRWGGDISTVFHLKHSSLHNSTPWTLSYAYFVSLLWPNIFELEHEFHRQSMENRLRYWYSLLVILYHTRHFESSFRLTKLHLNLRKSIFIYVVWRSGAIASVEVEADFLVLHNVKINVGREYWVLHNVQVMSVQGTEYRACHGPDIVLLLISVKTIRPSVNWSAKVCRRFWGQVDFPDRNFWDVQLNKRGSNS